MLKEGKQAAFLVAAYDRGRELVIDPMIFSTYLGGTGSDLASAIAVDAAGNSYVTGAAGSANFPTILAQFRPRTPGWWTRWL